MNQSSNQAATEALLTLLLEDAVIRQRMLAEPLLNRALIAHALRISTLECGVVQQQVAAFLDASPSATTAHPRPELLLHLRQCPQCYELFHTAGAIITAQASGELPAWPQLPL